VRQLNPCAASACAGGGNAVKDPKTGVYHAFFAAMRNEPGSKGVCNLGAWTSNSEVIHVTSSSPTGPFKMQDVALPPWHHNPQAILHPDGHWLLYTIGTVGVPPQKSCGVGAALADRPRLGGPKTGEYVQCHYSQSPSGPWTFLNITKDASNPGIFGGGSTSNSDHGTNPTPVVLANGTVVIGAHDNRGFYVQVGPTWRGPFTRWPGGYLFEFECAPNCPSAHGGGKPHGPPAYVFEVRKRPSFLQIPFQLQRRLLTSLDLLRFDRCVCAHGIMCSYLACTSRILSCSLTKPRRDGGCSSTNTAAQSSSISSVALPSRSHRISSAPGSSRATPLLPTQSG
jgi:hypothetical protein